MNRNEGDMHIAAEKEDTAAEKSICIYSAFVIVRVSMFLKMDLDLQIR